MWCYLRCKKQQILVGMFITFRRKKNLNQQFKCWCEQLFFYESPEKIDNTSGLMRNDPLKLYTDGVLNTLVLAGERTGLLDLLRLRVDGDHLRVEVLHLDRGPLQTVLLHLLHVPGHKLTLQHNTIFSNIILFRIQIWREQFYFWFPGSGSVETNKKTHENIFCSRV